MTKLLYIPLIFLLPFVSIGQQTIAWESALGGTKTEVFLDIKQTQDGGFVAVGSTNSNDGVMNELRGLHDCYVMKFSQSGALEWTKLYGGSFEDYPASIAVVPNGGYIFAGNTNSQNGDIVNPIGDYDGWVVRLDHNGNVLWAKNFGSYGYDNLSFVANTDDGNFIVGGANGSNSVQVSDNRGGVDAWVLKLDAQGNIIWKKSYGGSDSEFFRFGQQTFDGGYIFSGGTSSTDGDIGDDNHGLIDMWVVKMDSIGDIQWQKCLGGSNWEEAWAIKQGRGGEYLIAGQTKSNDGDVSNNHGDYDFWVIKLSTDGKIVWQKALGGTGEEIALSINENNSGDIVASGRTFSNNGDVSGNHGFYDQWVVALSESGEILWQRCIGGANSEEAYKSILVTDGIVTVGYTSSKDGDISENHHYGGFESECWINKLAYDNPAETELLLFEATGLPNGNSLFWSVSATNDNQNYVLERSSDGVVFAPLVTINGTTLPQVLQYSFLDANPLAGYNFYRVCMFNADGTKSYSQIRKLFNVESYKFNVFPNPAKEMVRVFLNEPGDWTLQIADALGRIIETVKVQDKYTDFDVSYLHVGAYFIFASKGNTNQSLKFIKID
ncbi:MAG: T9SS type A sorting domain-containing protein [Saprospiraceae bacterium]|nr:T9SS type A sorting domain-containing protein [Saprospiraceae bacterium]MBP7699780.1 T9SS type A sorting domain-containing protein [Saprospiraceae bacterium]